MTQKKGGSNMKAKIILTLVVGACAVIFGPGCEDDESGDWRFENRSSYRVYVAPNGQDWSPATIAPGGSVTLEDSGGRGIQYVYTPSAKVRPESAKGNKVIFYNR